MGFPFCLCGVFFHIFVSIIYWYVFCFIIVNDIYGPWLFRKPENTYCCMDSVWPMWAWKWTGFGLYSHIMIKSNNKYLCLKWFSVWFMYIVYITTDLDCLVARIVDHNYNHESVKICHAENFHTRQQHSDTFVQ